MEKVKLLPKLKGVKAKVHREFYRTDKIGNDITSSKRKHTVSILVETEHEELTP